MIGHASCRLPVDRSAQIQEHQEQQERNEQAKVMARQALLNKLVRFGRARHGNRSELALRSQALNRHRPEPVPENPIGASFWRLEGKPEPQHVEQKATAAASPVAEAPSAPIPAATSPPLPYAKMFVGSVPAEERCACALQLTAAVPCPCS
jgi:hypothetical protein